MPAHSHQLAGRRGLTVLSVLKGGEGQSSSSWPKLLESTARSLSINSLRSDRESIPAGRSRTGVKVNTMTPAAKFVLVMKLYGKFLH